MASPTTLSSVHRTVNGKRIRNLRVARRSFDDTGHLPLECMSNVRGSESRTNRALASILEAEFGTDVLGVGTRKPLICWHLRENAVSMVWKEEVEEAKEVEEFLVARLLVVGWGERASGSLKRS